MSRLCVNQVKTARISSSFWDEIYMWITSLLLRFWPCWKEMTVSSVLSRFHRQFVRYYLSQKISFLFHFLCRRDDLDLSPANSPVNYCEISGSKISLLVSFSFLGALFCFRTYQTCLPLNFCSAFWTSEATLTNRQKGQTEKGCWRTLAQVFCSLQMVVQFYAVSLVGWQLQTNCKHSQLPSPLDDSVRLFGFQQ